MPRTKKTESKIEIDKYTHTGEKWKNNPPVGLVSTATDKLNGKTKYQHDPHIDPYLSWAGKVQMIYFDYKHYIYNSQAKV